MSQTTTDCLGVRRHCAILGCLRHCYSPGTSPLTPRPSPRCAPRSPGLRLAHPRESPRSVFLPQTSRDATLVWVLRRSPPPSTRPLPARFNLSTSEEPSSPTPAQPLSACYGVQLAGAAGCSTSCRWSVPCRPVARGAHPAKALLAAASSGARQ